MNNTYKKLSAMFIVALFLFSSCSRELTSIPQTNKLANVQTLEKQRPTSQKAEPLALVKVTSPQLLPPDDNPIVLPSNSNKTIKTSQTNKLTHHPIAGMLPKHVGKEIVKQANIINHLGSNNNEASYSKTNNTEGWIGLAITCLIVAVILFALGFGFAAAIIWEIGIIILVIAIIFFILWLLAKAI